MKIILFSLISVFLITQSAFAQAVLQGKTQGYEKFVVAIKPLNGKFISGWYNQKIEPNGRFSIKVESKKPGFIYFSSFNSPLILVFYMPGMQSFVKLQKGGEEPQFSGDFSEENAWLNKLKRKRHSPYNGKHPSLTDTLFHIKAEHIFTIWKEMVNSSIQDLEENCSDCHPLFKEFARKDITYFYANEFVTSIFRNTPNTIIWGDTKNFKAADWDNYQKFKESYGHVWDSIYSYVPVSNDAFYSEDYMGFLRAYFDMYRLGYKREKADQHPDQDARDKLMIQMARESLDTGPFEALYAFNLEKRLGMGPYTFTQNYIQLYEDFVAEFPNSDYLVFLKTRMKTVYEFLEIPENNFTQKSFLPTNDYNSFNDLLSKFKDKVVFVDLWATWCGPCLDEFAYVDELQNFVEHKPIEALYISVDKAKDEKKWKNFTSKYNLKGTHIRASKNLIEDIWSKIGDEGVRGYPRYIIIDQEGKVAIKDAKKPGSKKELYRQLSETLEERN